MRRMVAGWALGVVTLLVSASLAEAGCPCPKQKLAEMYGSVSAIQPKTSPRLPPPVMTAEDLAIRHVARGELPVRLPLPTPASDQMIDLLQVELAAAD
jgi:hypothetical protein